MKNILLFSLLILIISLLIITSLVIDKPTQNFKFSKNTTVRIYRSKTKQIEKIPLEKYVEGVVSGEMPASFKEEALKAQAVAARSYIMYKIINSRKKKYDVVDTVLNQVYLDEKQLKKKWGSKYKEYKNKIHKIVEETSYEYITYKGKVADALFFSTSGGYTENSEEIFVSKVHYLQSVKSDWDKISPVFREQNEYSLTDFCKMLQIDCTNKPIVKVTSKTTGGKINKITIGNSSFTGKDIVKKFNLRTTNFDINIGDNVIITTKGYGHGVGMSQYGAEGMARAGYSYIDILKYYYNDIKLEKIKF